MTTFYNFTLKIETVKLKQSLTTFWGLEMSLMLLCMFGLFLDKKKIKTRNVKLRIILNAQKLQ